MLPFAELFPDVRDSPWRAIEEQAARFVAETEAGLAGDREALRVRAGKEFVVRLLSYGVDLGLDDPWFAACASHRMLDIANTYLGLWSKLEYVDMWYSVPQPPDADRIASQRWHRDFNDKHLLKAFLYLVDVDAGDGAVRVRAGERSRRALCRRLALAPARRELSARRRAREADPRGRNPHVHGAEGDDGVLQHVGLPPRRLRDREAARARDRDVLLTGVAWRR